MANTTKTENNDHGNDSKMRRSKPVWSEAWAELTNMSAKGKTYTKTETKTKTKQAVQLRTGKVCQRITRGFPESVAFWLVNSHQYSLLLPR